MAYLYGSNLSATGQPLGNVGFNHSRLRQTSFVYTGTPTNADDLVIATIKSSDRIKDIRVSCIDGSATAGAMNVGLWTVSLSNGTADYTVVDADLFASAFAINADIAYPGTSVFEEAGTLTIANRGSTAWACAAVGAASYTEDPGETFAIVGEISTTVDAAITLLVDVEYVAGD